MPAKRARRSESFASVLGANIRASREEHRLTQRQLSARAEYDLAQLSAVENGLAVPRTDALTRIADVLHASLDELCGRSAFTAAETGTGLRSSDRLLSAGNMAIVEELRELRKRIDSIEARQFREVRPRSKT